MQCQYFGECSGGSASQVVTGAETLMGSEPLPPAAAAAILRVLAATAASPGPGRAFYDLGSVSDRAGHQGVAIAYEYGNGTPTTGGAAGSSCTTTTSGGRTTVTCSASGSVSVSASGTSGSGSGLPPSFMESSLLVLVFAPGTGALLGVEYAYCNAPVQAHLATGKCFATSYDQFLEIKAVQSIPATPTAPPSTGTP